LSGAIKKYSLIIVLYAVISIFFTYPLFLDPGGSYIEGIAGGSNDQFLSMWNAWWAKKTLFELFSSPMSTTYLYYPEGADLSLHELSIVNGLITVPFQTCLPAPMGVVLGYNVALVFSFVLAGLGAYALCYHLTRDTLASFVAGIAFALAPYRSMHIIHLPLLSTGWIPLYLLALLNIRKKPNILNAAVGAIAALFMLYSCMMFVYFVFLATLVMVSYWAVCERKEFFNRQVISSLIVFGALCGLAVATQVMLVSKAGAAQEQPGEIIEIFSANALGYIVPSMKHMVYKPVLSAMAPLDFSGVPGDGTFLGYTLVVLAAVGIVKTRWRTWGLWVVMALFFYVLSLGPSLHILRSTFRIPLPYTLFHNYFPFFSVMRSPGRFAVLVTLSCAIIAAYGLSHILNGATEQYEQDDTGEKNRLSRRRRLYGIGVGLLLLLELWHLPFAAKKATVPDIYFEIAEEEGTFGVLDLPYSRYRDIARYMFYQTVHDKPIAGGLLSRKSGRQRQIEAVLRSLRSSPAGLSGKGELRAFEMSGFRYVIYHSIEDDTDEVAHTVRIP
jgi:hypothetical protein